MKKKIKKICKKICVLKNCCYLSTVEQLKNTVKMKTGIIKNGKFKGFNFEVINILLTPFSSEILGYSISILDDNGNEIAKTARERNDLKFNQF